MHARRLHTLLTLCALSAALSGCGSIGCSLGATNHHAGGGCAAHTRF